MKKMLIIILTLFLIIVITFTFMFRSMLLLNFRKAFYSEQKMLETYIHLSSEQPYDIITYKLDIDDEMYGMDAFGLNIKSYYIFAEILVDQNSVGDLLKYYSGMDYIKNPVLGSFELQSTSFSDELDYCIWYPTSVYFCDIISKNRTQSDTYIYVSKPKNGKCHLILSKRMVGFNENNWLDKN